MTTFELIQILREVSAAAAATPDLMNAAAAELERLSEIMNNYAALFSDTP